MTKSSNEEKRRPLQNINGNKKRIPLKPTPIYPRKERKPCELFSPASIIERENKENILLKSMNVDIKKREKSDVNYLYKSQHTLTTSVISPPLNYIHHHLLPIEQQNTQLPLPYTSCQPHIANQVRCCSRLNKHLFKILTNKTIF